MGNFLTFFEGERKDNKKYKVMSFNYESFITFYK